MPCPATVSSACSSKDVDAFAYTGGRIIDVPVPQDTPPFAGHQGMYQCLSLPVGLDLKLTHQELQGVPTIYCGVETFEGFFRSVFPHIPWLFPAGSFTMKQPFKSESSLHHGRLLRVAHC